MRPARWRRAPTEPARRGGRLRRGEMAGRPLDAMAAIAVGLRRLSMTAGAIGPVKAMIRSLELAPLERLTTELLDRPDRSLRRELKNFAVENGIAI